MSFEKSSLDVSDNSTRRQFLQRGSAGMLGWAVAGELIAASAAASAPQQAENNKRIQEAKIGQAIRIPNCSGDVWTTTWADDDHLYSVSDDTTGFNKACNSNLAVQRISGGPPPDVIGVTVNPMKEFGKAGEQSSQDEASWKASGLICVNGVLYLAVSRHRYDGVGDTGSDSAHQTKIRFGTIRDSARHLLRAVILGLARRVGKHFWVQETWDASIVKSSDHGLTWSPAPELGHSMFPGRVFSNPFFVQYGKDGRGKKDGRDRFVYAISNDGSWNNGNWMTLGRVAAELIGRLDPHDWEFVHGFDDKHQPIWKPRHDNALYVFRSPGRTSMTGVHYIAPLDLYIMPQWHYPMLDNPKRRWKVSRWEFYSAPAPWGPWTLFHTQDFEPQGFYNPSIPSKFISEDGKEFWIFVAGDFTDQGPNNFYGLNVLPVTLAIKTG